MRRVFLLLLLLCSVWISGCQKPKHNLSVCAIFKDEADYFKEWIEYHRLVGVDHFYLYNNSSTDNFLGVLAPYIKEGIITLIDWPDQNPNGSLFSWVKLTQVGAYEHACKVSALGKTKWLALIDIDEFLVPSYSNKMTAVLGKYKDAPAIQVFWQIFGTSGLHAIPKGQLLIEALHKIHVSRSDPGRDPFFCERIPKTILKPELFDKFDWAPHTCLFKNGQRAVAVEKTEAQINHYMCRTIDYFYQSKLKKKEHMDKGKLTETQINDWLQLGNDAEDKERLIHRFIPELRKRMGLQTIYISPGFWGDLFDLNNPTFNRDGCLEPLCKLRDEAAKIGYDVRQTNTLQSLKDFEYLIVFEVIPDQIQYLKQYPKEKLILFLWEPPSVLPQNYNPEYHRYFSKIYTWNDALVDNKKYFKLYYPVLHPLIPDPVDFRSKKLCALVGCNKMSPHPDELYTERLKWIRFFETLHQEEFDLYGKGWPASCKVYQGAIGKKVDRLKFYKFSIAYENVKGVPGYITEKIFDSFHAGCVPVYWGAPNIAQYIPKNCFIAREDFKDEQELYEFMKNMDEAQYLTYLKNIRQFLASKQAKLYSADQFVKTVMDLCGLL